jgi:hypothetical protein
MQTIDVLHAAAVLTLALVLIRAIQAVLEHYAPEAGPTVAMRYIYGGP